MKSFSPVTGRILLILFFLFVSVLAISSEESGSESESESSDQEDAYRRELKAKSKTPTSSSSSTSFTVLQCGDTKKCCKRARAGNDEHVNYNFLRTGFTFGCSRSLKSYNLDCLTSAEVHIDAFGTGKCHYTSDAERGPQPFGGMFSRRSEVSYPYGETRIYVPIDTRMVTSHQICMDFYSPAK